VTEQGYPPRRLDQPGRADRTRTPQESRANDWQMLRAFEPHGEPESDLPPWAMPGGVEPLRAPRRPTRTVDPEPVHAPSVVGEQTRLNRPDRAARRPGRSRAAKTRRRRSRRRLVLWGSVGVVVVIIAGFVYYLAQPTPQPKPYVTELLKGEYRQVPNACRVVSTSALSQYLGGTPSKGVQTQSGAANSECTYQLDRKPTFRVLNITVQACQPSLIAPGNGSATSYAMYTFARTKQALTRPPKHANEPPAKISTISGLGQDALSAVQVYRVGGINDRVTVLVRFHNVLITAVIWATVSGGFGPVSMTQLGVDAQAAARAVLATVMTEPAVT
jgi:hypothetical protein